MNWLTRAKLNEPEPEVVPEPTAPDPRQSADLINRHSEVVAKTLSWLTHRQEDLEAQIAFLQEELRQAKVVYAAHTAAQAVLQEGSNDKHD